jgi:uncharacterized membrane protein
VGQGASPMLAPQTQTQPQSRATKQNIIAVLFYAGMIVGLFGLVLPVIFLIIDPYKKIRFVRFHAFQAILVNLVFWAIGLFVNLSGRGDPFSMWTEAKWIWVASILCSVFLMAKAYVNEMFTIPGIGDVAMKLADQGGVN